MRSNSVARRAESFDPRLLWSWRYGVLNSDLPAPVRLLLLTLAHHMSDSRDSCFLSLPQLATETGMSEERATQVLRTAVETSWLEVRALERDQLCITRMHTS